MTFRDIALTVLAVAVLLASCIEDLRADRN